MRFRSARRCEQALADPGRLRRRASAGHLFPLFQPQLPGDRLGDGARVGRAVRPADGAAGAASARARRLLQLDDLQRCCDRRARRCSTRRTARVLRDDLGGRRPDCPVLAPSGCDLAAYRARQQRRALLAAGRPAHLGARPRRRSAGCCSTTAGTRAGRFLREASLRRDVSARPGASTAATATPRAASIAPTASPCRACRSRRRAATTICSAAADHDRPCRRRLWRCARASGSTRARGFGIAYFATGNGDDPPRGPLAPIARSRRSWRGGFHAEGAQIPAYHS